MNIFSLGITLEEVTAVNNEGTSEGYIFVGSSKEIETMTSKSSLVYDGEIDLNAIQFCKIESQQECLAGTLCIPRLSDVCGSKYKIQFFVNNKNIVIVDNTGFTMKQIKRIRLNRTKLNSI